MKLCAMLNSAMSRDTPASMHHVLKVPRNPCTVPSASMRRMTRRSPSSPMALRDGDRNTRPLPPVRLRAASSTTSASAHSGMRCARFAFIRAAGMVQVRASMSISFPCAPSTSEVRHAVRTSSRNAPVSPIHFGSAMSAAAAYTPATSSMEIDSWCLVRCPDFGRIASMAPFAGLSTRCPCATHQSNTSRMRWRSAFAVGALPS